MTSSRLPWERVPYESRQAYEAFCGYRDMGSSRSIAKVAQQLGKTTTLLNRWSSRWNWVLRAQQYDDELERRARLDREQEIKDTRRRHLQLARLLLNKVYERMQSLEPDDITPATLDRLLRVSAELELTSLGISSRTTRTEVVGPEGEALEISARIVTDALIDPDTRHALDVLSQRLESQSSGNSG